MSKRAGISFFAKIYKVGINACVDVPQSITSKMTANKGYIKIRGRINGHPFQKSLVPVRDAPYRLFVNLDMLKGAETELGKRAEFIIEEDRNVSVQQYPIPRELNNQLRVHGLKEQFLKLSEARRREILKYLNNLKTDTTLQKNIQKLIKKLKDRAPNIRLP